MRKLSIILLTATLLIWLARMETAFSDSDTASHSVTMTVNEIALIGLNSTATITLEMGTSTSTGEAPQDVTDNGKLLQYTSLVPDGATRSIVAAWGAATDAAPAGTSLKLQSTSVPANCGTAASQITVSATAQSIITNIGSCATGVGVNGAEITYTLSVDDFTQLAASESKTVTITYTLTDAS
jgi:hypothetical protein